MQSTRQVYSCTKLILVHGSCQEWHILRRKEEGKCTCELMMGIVAHWIKTLVLKHTRESIYLSIWISRLCDYQTKCLFWWLQRREIDSLQAPLVLCLCYNNLDIHMLYHRYWVHFFFMGKNFRRDDTISTAKPFKLWLCKIFIWQISHS